MGESISPAIQPRIVAVTASPEIMCVVFDVLGRRGIGINADYLGTQAWDKAVCHATGHLSRGIDVFVICTTDCSC